MPVQRSLLRKHLKPLWPFQHTSLSTEFSWPACIRGQTNSEKVQGHLSHCLVTASFIWRFCTGNFFYFCTKPFFLAKLWPPMESPFLVFTIFTHRQGTAALLAPTSSSFPGRKILVLPVHWPKTATVGEGMPRYLSQKKKYIAFVDL